MDRPPPPYELAPDLEEPDEKLEDWFEVDGVDCRFDADGVDCRFDAVGDCLLDVDGDCLLDAEGDRFPPVLFNPPLLFDTDGRVEALAFPRRVAPAPSP